MGACSPLVIPAQYFNAHVVLARIRQGLRGTFEGHVPRRMPHDRTTKIARTKELLIAPQRRGRFKTKSALSALHFGRNSVWITGQLQLQPGQDGCTLLQRVAVKPSVAL